MSCEKLFITCQKSLVFAALACSSGYFYLQSVFSPHSSAAGQDGVHLASVLTKDKWALGPQWFTLAARGFQNSKLFFITAMWYEVSCSRCSNIYRSRLWSGEFIKFPHLSKKSHLSEWLAFCLCQLKADSPEARKTVRFFGRVASTYGNGTMRLICSSWEESFSFGRFIVYFSIQCNLFCRFFKGCRQHRSMLFWSVSYL